MKFSKPNKKKFVHGSFIYHYDLVRQERRTLGLTVMPDLSIRLKSPRAVDDNRIEHFLRRKWFWLEKQLNFFRKYQRKIYTKEYVTGESFLYLGKQYQLLVKKASEPKVVLSKREMTLSTEGKTVDVKRNKRILDSWYAKRTDKVFKERLKAITIRFGYREVPELFVREMHKRWGSFLSTKKIVLNPKLIFTSKDCIDYVITHELCHMKFKNHDKLFFVLLDEKCPKWRKLKEKLEMYRI